MIWFIFDLGIALATFVASAAAFFRVRNRALGSAVAFPCHFPAGRRGRGNVVPARCAVNLAQAIDCTGDYRQNRADFRGRNEICPCWQGNLPGCGVRTCRGRHAAASEMPSASRSGATRLVNTPTLRMLRTRPAWRTRRKNLRKAAPRCAGLSRPPGWPGTIWRPALARSRPAGCTPASHLARREPPPRDIAVELDPLVGGQAIPELGAVNVDEVVGDQPAIAFERPGPVDVGRRVPLIDLGLLVEPPHVGVLAIVIMPEIRGVPGRSGVRVPSGASVAEVMHDTRGLGKTIGDRYG